MKEPIFKKRIPTLLGIVMIIIGIAATTLFARHGVRIIGRAAPSETPENIRIANISDASFTISYITADKVLGTINFGQTEKLGNIAFDNADSNSTPVSHTAHISTIKNLAPATTYFFSITSGTTNFLNNEKPFRVTTAPKIQAQPDQSPPLEMNGNIVFADNQNAESLVYISPGGGQMLATRVHPDGSYKINLSAVRSQDLASYLSISDNTTINMLMVGNSEQSNITLLAKQIHNIPTIIFSKNYDFTLGTNPIASAAASIGFTSFSASPSAAKNPAIISPKKNEAFTDVKPLFKGIASPSADIQIEIHSDEQITTKVTADKNGSWTFRPQEALSPGVHTIRITTRDAYGILKTIQQSFTVFAAGSQVTQSATPSATVTPSISPSLTPTATLTPTKTPIPPTLFPTQTPKQIIVTPTLPPQQNIPSPGNASFMIYGIAAIAATIAGTLFFLLTHGRIL